MTTIVGIKAEKGTRGVILASDLSGTREFWDQKGDVAYRHQTKSEVQKIYIDKKKEIALCPTGSFDNHYINFLSSILEGDIDIRKATETGNFSEFLDMNLGRWEGRIPTDDRNSLVVATRFDGNPQLYTCWPLGRVEERSWTSIGSGSNYALNYISHQGILIPRGLTLKKAVELVDSSLDYASTDLYTGGLDMVIITKDGISEHGKNIRTHIKGGRQRAIQEIKKDL